ncbi:MAG: 23S rRNA (guanosine(2251)-2'-O)-methyltransferase RlmB [Coriobacteriia bacterium]|nr:23S rRNA (guanosine(2251)-2'-O)-methyltransferase RlmB [Coriobacteriia bacterium]
MHIEGKHAVLEALRAGMPLERILVAEGAKPDRGVDEIRRLASADGVRVDVVARKELDRLSERGAHQGIVAAARPFDYASLDTVIRESADDRWSLVIALDHITDPGNLGAIARTAEVIGAAAVLVPGRRSAGVTPAAWKAAAGALAHVPLVQETNLVRSLVRLKEAGYWVAGASECADQSVWDAALEGRIVLVMGSEGEGLSRLTRETCDFLVSLPQAGKIGSLNVAQATTAIAYEWVRRREAAR